MPIAARSYFKYVNRATIAASTCAAIIDAIGNASGAIRIAMEADGWTFELDGAAGVSLTPPNASAQRIVVAGVDAGTPTPPMHADLSDTFATGIILVGLAYVVTTGTFDWDGTKFGYTGSSVVNGYQRSIGVSSNSTHISVAYNDHCIAVFIDGDANSSFKYFHAGGIGIPADPALVEPDGRMWGVANSGGVATGGLIIGMWGNNTATTSTTNCIYSNGAANGNAHTGVRLPSTGAWLQAPKDGTQPIGALQMVQSANFRALGGFSLIHATDYACMVEGVYRGADGRHMTVDDVNITGPTTVAGVLNVGGGFSSDGDCAAFELMDLTTQIND